jgi:phosphatidate cytidylyltransferase
MHNVIVVSGAFVSALLKVITDLPPLVQRIITASVLAPIFLVTFYSGGFLLTIIIIATLLGAFREWLHLIYRSGMVLWPPMIEYAGYGFITLSLLMVSMTDYHLAFLVLIFGVLFMAVSSHFYLEKGPRDVPQWLSIGLFYFGTAAISIQGLRYEGSLLSQKYEWAPLMILVALVWTTDIFAYIVGRAIGGKKLAPRISPNKTWAGLLGGMFFASIITGLLAFYWQLALWPWYFLIGLFIAFIAQMGDLFESYMKRRAGFKDSGHILPGHGGILDRIDGLLAAAPVFAIILYWMMSL